MPWVENKIGRQRRCKQRLREDRCLQIKVEWVSALPREVELTDTYYQTFIPNSTPRRYLRRWLFCVAAACAACTCRTGLVLDADVTYADLPGVLAMGFTN